MLTIANFTADYVIPQGAPDPVALRARLDRVVRQRLSAEVEAGLSTPAADTDAVYRIRHVRLELWLDVLRLSDAEIAHVWAVLTTRAVAHALMYGLPGEVVRYDDQAHFVAAFLGDALTGQAWSRWVYEEFAPLRDVPVGHIAAQLLAARPALLVPVAQHLAHNRQLEPLLQHMQLADIRLLLRHGLGFDTPPEVVMPASAVAAMLQALRHGMAFEPGETVAQARNTLRLYLALAMAHSTLTNPRLTIAICHHLALVHSLWTARPSHALWQALANQEIDSPAALAPLLASLGEHVTPACEWLRTVLATLEGRTYLAQLIPVALPEGVLADASALGRGRAGQRPHSSPVHRTPTAFAGLALLLPVIRAMELHHSLSHAGIYQVLLTAVGRTYRPLAWSDLGVAWLAGIVPSDMERARDETVAWPDLEAWDTTGDLVQRAAQADEYLGPLPHSAWALLVLQRFAQGLRGFADSSPAYLARQFLHVPGTLHRTEETLEAHLSRAPLGIVLRMAGRDGEQGDIPWLAGRRLVIYLPEG
jgi:hypothetical protein